MLEIVKKIESCIEKLPADGQAVSASVDPNPLRRLVFHAGRGIELAAMCLRYYANPMPSRAPREPWKEWKNERVTSRPWVSYDHKTWQARRHRLLRLMVDEYARLSVDYPDSTMRCTYRASETLYVLYLHLTECVRATLPPEEALKISSETAAGDNPYVAREQLAVAEGPVGTFSTRKLLDSMLWLTAKFNELKYDPLLEIYMDRLEHRAARLALLPGTSLVHDVDTYRKLVDRSTDGAIETYVPNSRFIANLSSITCALYHRMFLAVAFPVVTAEELGIRVPERASMALRVWFVERAKLATSRNSSQWLREQWVLANLWPAEREVYRQDNPNDSTTTLAILQKHRGDNHPIIKKHRVIEYDKIIKSADRAPADIVEKDLPLAPNATESVLLQLALVESTALFMRNRCFGVDWYQYAVLSSEVELQMRSLQSECTVPHIVQLFHHFQLVHKGRVVYFNSYIESLCAWFSIVMRQLRGHLSQRMTVEEVAREIFGEVRECEHWFASIPPPTATRKPAARASDPSASSSSAEVIYSFDPSR